MWHRKCWKSDRSLEQFYFEVWLKNVTTTDRSILPFSLMTLNHICPSVFKDWEHSNWWQENFSDGLWSVTEQCRVCKTENGSHPAAVSMRWFLQTAQSTKLTRNETLALYVNTCSCLCWLCLTGKSNMCFVFVCLMLAKHHHHVSFASFFGQC